MVIKIFKFIHTLRVFFLVFIIVAFLFVLGINPVSISKFLGAKLGSAIGMSTSVPENPFNKLALQLKEKEEKLIQREQELDAREKELEPQNKNEYLITALGLGIIVLFALVLLNYYLDYRRKKQAVKIRKQ
ncbi:MAG: hypothetical protein U9R06_00740 [Patescibacteria group bacterium]|nr:hypothetical protein [Patescibacteria group bacterium]